MMNSLQIPEDFEPNTVIALGYYGDADQLPGQLRERELAERHRIPTEDFAIYNKIERLK